MKLQDFKTEIQMIFGKLILYRLQLGMRSIKILFHNHCLETIKILDLKIKLILEMHLLVDHYILIKLIINMGNHHKK